MILNSILMVLYSIGKIILILLASYTMICIIALSKSTQKLINLYIKSKQ